MKRTVEVSTRGTKLYLARARLVVERESDVLARIPIEDVGVLILDGSGISISSGVLQALSDAGGTAVVCDQRHLPNGVLLPVVANSTHVQRLRLQAAASSPLKKQIWAAIVRAKVRNQAALLQDAAAKLRMQRIAGGVRSGDAGNAEAQGARVYWASVFTAVLDAEFQPFRRTRYERHPNGLLNYGYAILRAATARSLCAAGLHAGLGLHHRNKYSGFPLADDLMEPFRPWVDASVIELLVEGVAGIDKAAKARLLGVMTARVETSLGKGPLSVALERAGATLVKALEAAEEGQGAREAARLVDLPSWPDGVRADP